MTSGKILTSPGNFPTSAGNIPMTSGKILTSPGKIQMSSGNIPASAGNMQMTPTGTIPFYQHSTQSEISQSITNEE